MKLFGEDFDPLPSISKKNSQLKSSTCNGLGKIFKGIEFLVGRFKYAKFNFKRKGDNLYFDSKKINISSLLPHFGIAVLFVSVIVGSTFASTDKFESYEDLQSSILTPSEIETICKSIDKYTHVIKESELPFFQDRNESNTSTLVTSRGFVSQPEAVLTSFSQKNSDSLTGIKPRDQLVINYTVSRGDSLSIIANKYNISVSTLRWANQLANLDYIKTGQKLIVPKKDGVWHEVEKNQTISGLVEKYSANYQATLDFNGLSKKDELKEGQRLLVVGGEKPLPRVASSVSVASNNISNSAKPSATFGSGGSDYNTFPYGWCTWYVASRKNIPWIGNARDWLPNSRAMGYQTGHTPAVGSIIVLNESWWGHVGIVEAVYGNQVKFSEMNGVAGWGRVGTRTIPSYHSKILGYIYK